MIGHVRGAFTLIGVAGAGLLLWIATLFSRHTTGGYWASAGVIAGAGLAMALSQLLGGWTKWGWPRVSGRVFLWAFVPTFIVASWILLGDQPHREWGGAQINDWSKTLHCNGLVH